MIEVRIWIFVAMIIGLVVAAIMLEVQQKKINKLKEKLKNK